MNKAIQSKCFSPFIVSAIAVICFWLLPEAKAVIPAPDGGYPGGNTAEGQNALLSLTTGGFNTAVGYFSLFTNTAGSFNTAVGAGALDLNIASNNTATGAAALLLNTTGADNTATGVDALAFNDTGIQNTANGAFALFSNTDGANNTASGRAALEFNTHGNFNTAIGGQALNQNTTGGFNTAIGLQALGNSTTGNGNTVLGAQAGTAVITASQVICIGSSGADVSNSCFIGEIFGTTSASGIPVLINSNDKLGTMTSSRRFKDEIKPMDKTSEALFALKPVSFRYKKEIDPAGKSQFGLVAEDVEKVNPDLIVRDKEGKAYSVRYDQVNAMLLNEFLKEHRKVEAQDNSLHNQQATITKIKSMIVQQQKALETVTAQLKEQAAQIQKVSARIDVSTASPQLVRSEP